VPRTRSGRGNLRRCVSAAGMAVLGVVAVPGIASAATVTGATGAIGFAADPGETNTVTISPVLDPSTYAVTDPANALVGEGDCIDDGSPAVGETVTCVIPDLTNLTVTLDDMDDSVDTTGMVATVGSSLAGDGGDDTLSSGPGDDQLVGGPGDDTMDAGGGADSLAGQADEDTYDGGAGVDTVSFAGAPGGVLVGPTTPGIATGDSEFQETLNNIENATGSPFNDTLIASAEQNTIEGAGGDDTFNGAPGGSGGGDDTFIGGAGTADQLIYTQSNSGLTFDTTGSPTVTGDGTTDAFPGVELVVGSSFPDTYIGGAGIDNFEGSGGADTITGGAEDDILVGGGGNDTLAGNAGVDQLDGGTGPGASVDTADYSAAAGSVTSNLTTQATTIDGDGSNDTLTGIENLTGSNQADELTGSAVANTIDALGGADTVDVRDSSADTVDCGAAGDSAITDLTETSVANCETIDDPNPTGTPAITGSNPASGANDNAPEITGTAPVGSTVSLFTSADCSGTPVATGSAGAFSSPGLTVNVADNSTTTLRARATSLDIDGASACSGAFTYVESTFRPTPPPTDLLAPETKIKNPKRKTTDRTPTYKLSSSEANSTFECKVDKRKYEGCRSKETLKKLKHGKHVFLARAVDAAGNADPTPAKDRFVVKRRKH
jgi:Ca2+-binding RTX toxin-like protein